MEFGNIARRSEQHDTPSMTCLSNEILIIIFDFLPKISLRKSSQVCRKFHDIAIPILFRAIDLSICPILDLDNLEDPLQWPSFAQWIFVLQWRFAKQIAVSPSYASFIRTFSWTMGLEHHFDYNDRGLEEDFDETLIYSMFTHMTKATHINIDTGSRHPEAIPRVPSLFPSAKHIHLGGKMHYTLASSILHGDSKAPLISLTLDNIIEGGLIYDPETKESVRFQHFQHYNAFAGIYNGHRTVKEIWPANRPPKQILAGPMRRLLTPASFRNRCRRLQYLCLRKQGQQHPRQMFPSRELTHDLDVYDEWASFIRSVSPKVLVIAHLGKLQQGYFGSHLLSSQGPEIALMDEAFRDRLLPVLIEPWKRLERLELWGVDRRVLHPSLERLSGVDVKIDEEVLPCWNAEAGR